KVMLGTLRVYKRVRQPRTGLMTADSAWHHMFQSHWRVGSGGLSVMGGMSSLMAADPSFEPKFAELYRRTIAPLRRYLARLLGDTGEAEDIAHDAYLRVYRATQDHPAHKPEALLYTTAKRLAFNR